MSGEVRTQPELCNKAPEQAAHELDKGDLKVIEDFHKLYFKLLEKSLAYNYSLALRLFPIFNGAQL